MEIKPPTGMTEEQRKQLDNLTRLQQSMVINILSGMATKDAYVLAGGRCKPENIYTCSSEILRNPQVSSLISSVQSSVADRALITAEEIVQRLRQEAGLDTPLNPDDMTPANRMAALKMMGDYTGNFDKNRSKVELGAGETQYKPVTLAEFINGSNTEGDPEP